MCNLNSYFPGCLEQFLSTDIRTPGVLSASTHVLPLERIRTSVKVVVPESFGALTFPVSGPISRLLQLFFFQVRCLSKF